MKPRELVTNALSEGNVTGTGQTPSAEEITTGFKRLNMMIAQWRKKRWLVYRLSTLSITANGQRGYTIGPGADFDTPQRPSKIQSSYYRLINGPSDFSDANFDNDLLIGNANRVDTKVSILESREDYDRINMKRFYGIPKTVWLDPVWPQGHVYWNPIPQADKMILYLAFMGELAQFDTLDTDVDLPPEYEAAILYNLAIRLSATYGIAQDEAVVALAKDALNVIRENSVGISELYTSNVPAERDASRFNIYEGS